MRAKILGLLVLGMLAGPVTGRASPITIEFTGNVTNVSSVLSGTFNTTQTLAGSFTYDSGLTSVPGPGLGDVTYGPLTALTLTIGSTTFVWNGNSSGITINDELSPGTDLYRVFASIAAPQINGVNPTYFVFALVDYQATQLTDNTLPLLPPNLAEWEYRGWVLDFSTFSTADVVSGEITSLRLRGTGVTVPEPGTLALLGLGLAGLGLTRRRKAN